MQQLDDLLAAIVRGERMAWPATVNVDDFLGEATAHGVLPLVANAVVAGDGGWPASLVAALTRARREAALVEEVRRREAERMLSALDRARVVALVVKGLPLAFTHYAASWLRPRLDADILVREADCAATFSALESIGYVGIPIPRGRYVRPQACYSTCDARGIEHLVHVHWKISNRLLVADTLSYEDLAARRLAVPALGPFAWTVCPVHALLVACLHRVAHHPGRADRLIWLYDIHLLVARMTADEREELVASAEAKRVAAVCAAGLRAAAARFGSAVAVEIGDRLAAVTRAEPSAIYLRTDLTFMDLVRSDLQALPTWRARARLVREHLFPDPAFVLASHGVASRTLLPFLYVSRIAGGVAGWLRRTTG